jgi:hypothetical protein
VSASSTKSAWKLSEAMKPPTTPPRPIPRFITTRCMANVAERCARVVRPASRVDWAGQKNPLPMPVTALARKPCDGLCTNA